MASAETIGNLILDDMVVGVRNGLVITVLGSACAALAKKVFGSNSHIKKTIAKKLVENKKEKKA